MSGTPLRRLRMFECIPCSVPIEAVATNGRVMVRKIRYAAAALPSLTDLTTAQNYISGWQSQSPHTACPSDHLIWYAQPTTSASWHVLRSTSALGNQRRLRLSAAMSRPLKHCSVTGISLRHVSQRLQPARQGDGGGSSYRIRRWLYKPTADRLISPSSLTSIFYADVDLPSVPAEGVDKTLDSGAEV